MGIRDGRTVERDGREKGIMGVDPTKFGRKSTPLVQMLNAFSVINCMNT